MASGPRVLVNLRLLYLFFVLSCISFCESRPTSNDGTSDVITDTLGNSQVIDPTTDQTIAQGSASDGAGSGLDIPAVLWIAMVFITGLPLLTAGVRGGRLTSGTGAGLALAVAVWAALINTDNANGVPDIIIFLITMGLFLVGFVAGVLTIDYGVGAGALGIVGGLSIGIRIMLLKPDLLISTFFVNWILIALCGIPGIIVTIWRVRWGVIFGSTSSGTFLIILGIDLLLNRQEGMSRGLRFLFDRNSNHLLDILGNGYHPHVSTQIFLGASVAIIPIFAFAQHKLFPRPFWRSAADRPRSSWLDDPRLDEKGWFEKLRGRPNKYSDTNSTTSMPSENSQQRLEISAPAVLSYPTLTGQQKSRFSL